MRSLWAALVTLMAGLPCAFAQQDCSKALIPSTTAVEFDEVRNLSLAWQLSQDSYDKATHDFGANEIIYGVPVGANYSDFRTNIQRRSEALHLQDFDQRSFAYATSVL
jgi:hypothetical protein